MKSFNVKLLLYFFLININMFIFADDIVTLSVNQNEVYENETLYLSIKVENGDGEEEFEFPKQEVFDVKRAGQSSQHTIINGKSNRFISYEFILTPKKTGDFIFPAVTVISKGNKYVTNIFSGKILKAKDSKQELKNDLWVEFSADKNIAYIDEPLTLRFKIFSRAGFSLHDARYDFPKLTDFIMESETKDVFEKVINGMQYVVNEIRTVIYPTRKGEFEIKGASLIGSILKKDKSRKSNRRSSLFDMDSFFMDPFSDDPFFNGNVKKIPIHLNADVLKINVKALPLENKPEDFKGTVGNYQIKVEYSKLKDLKQGDAITITMEISGTGHISSIQEPVFKNTDGFKLFESEISVIPLSKEQSIAGKKVFKKMIMVEKAGTFTLPEITFSFFDPYQEKYITYTEKGHEITVQESENDNFENKLFDFKQKVISDKKLEITGHDILYLNTSSDALQKNTRALSKTFFRFILIIGFLLFFILISFSHLYHKYMMDPSYIRKRKAFSKFQKNMVKSKKIFKTDQKLAFSELSKALSLYLSDKTNLNISVWTAIEINQVFGSLDNNIGEDLKKYLSILDMGQYGLQSMDKTSWSEFLSNMEKTLKQIEKMNFRKNLI